MKADKTGRESKFNSQKLNVKTFFLNIILIEVVFDLPTSNLGGTSEKQSKFAESCVKLKSLSEKQHRQICHAS